MARLACRCPWCHRTLEVEVGVMAVDRWVEREGSRRVGRPPSEGGPKTAAERVRAYRARKKAARAAGGEPKVSVEGE